MTPVVGDSTKSPYVCPSCRGRYALKGAQSGKTYLCPNCRGALVFDSSPHASIDAAGLAACDAAEVPDDVARAGPEAQFGKYVLVRKLGQGGMGEVHLAWDRSLGRYVALKFVRRGDPEEIARLVSESKTAAGLAHPNIAPVFEAGEIGGRAYVAMQFVDGAALGPALPARDAAAVVRDAARAIAHAHSRGVVHRDLKPANLMRDREGRVFVVDFGLSKRVRAGASVSSAIVGTPSYMAPEQARGEAVDARADVYGLGATLYALAGGRPPFDGENPYEIVQKVIDGEAPPLDGELGLIAAKAMEKEPVRRYAGASEMADDLDRFLQDEPIEARPPGAAYRLGKKIRKHPALFATASAAAVLAAAGAVAWFGFVRRGEALEEKSKWERANRLGTMFDEVYARLSGDIRRAEDVGFGAAGLSGEEEAALLGRVDAELGRVGPPWNATSLAPAYRGWVLCNLGRVREGEAELERAVRAGGEATQDPYGLIFRARWRALAAYDRLQPPTRWGGGTEVFAHQMRMTAEIRRGLESVARSLDPIQRWTGWTEARESRHYRGLVRALATIGRGEGAAARAALEEVLSGPEVGDEAAFLLGYAHYFEGAFEEAAERWEALGVRRPRWAKAWFLAGAARQSEGEIVATRDRAKGLDRFERAVADFTRAIDVNPDSFMARHGRAVSRGSLAEEKARRGEDPRPIFLSALEDYALVLGIADPPAAALNNRGYLHRVYGDAEGRMGGDPMPWYDKAVSDLTACIDAGAELAVALVNRGAAHGGKAAAMLSRGLDPTEPLLQALADFDRAVKVDPGYAAARGSRGQIKLLMAEATPDPDETLGSAVADFDAALKIDPNYAVARAQRGNVHLRRGEAADRGGRDPSEHYRRAISDYDAVLEERAGDYGALTGRGSAMARLAAREASQGRDPSDLYRRAVADFDGAAKVDQANPLAYSSRGAARSDWAIHAAADEAVAGTLIQQAFDDFKSALERNSKYWRAHLSRGMLLHRLGRLDEAAAAYRAVLEIHPGQPQADSLLKSIPNTDY